MVDLKQLQEELQKINAEHQAIYSSEPHISSLKDSQKIIPRLQWLDLQILDFEDSIKLVIKTERKITRRYNHHKENLLIKIIENCKVYDALNIKTNSCKSAPVN